MFHLIFSLPAWYAIARFIIPLPWPPAVKVIVALLMLLSSQYLLFSKFSSGSAMSPEMPRAAIILFNWSFSSVLFIALAQMVLDGITLISILFQHPLELIPAVRYGVGIGAMLLAAFGVFQAIRVPPVKDITLSIKNLAEQFEGYQLLQLTDLHISRLFNGKWTSRLVKQANALGVDLIVITGDVIDGTLANRKRDVDPLRGLQAPDGVFAITGNHEYFFEQQVWTDHLDSLGMTPLMNSHRVIARQGENLVLAGVTDLSASRSGSPGPDLDKALTGAPRDAAVMLLDHQPRNARSNAAQGVGGQLSGHTHGGLIAGVDRLFARANGGFVSGHYDVDGMSLYVNNGTALWPGMAIRIGRPSELTRITLTGKN